MTLEKVCSLIEHKLINSDALKVVKIFNSMFPEELLGSIDSDEFKEEIVQTIIESIENDEIKAKSIYKKLFNEKISIDTEDYFDEEFENGSRN